MSWDDNMSADAGVSAGGGAGGGACAGTWADVRVYVSAIVSGAVVYGEDGRQCGIVIRGVAFSGSLVFPCAGVACGAWMETLWVGA